MNDNSMERLLAGVPARARRLTLAGASTEILEGGEGPPVVLLHGPAGFAAHWMRVIPGLVAARHRVIVPDLPGHGRSRALPPARVLDWLDELIDRTCAAPPAIVGHLLGGAIAARFAIGRGARLRRLVLVDTFGLRPLRPAPDFGAALGAFAADPREETHTRLWRQCARDLETLRRAMGELWPPFEAENIARARDPVTAAGARDLLDALGAPAIAPEELARIAVPTTLIWGRTDLATPLVVAEAASERFGWPLRVVEDANDAPPIEQPVAFLAALRDALGVEVAGLDGATVSVAPADLAARVAGPALRAGDAGWEDAIRIWNALAAQVPALVVQPTTAQEVAAVVGLARERRLLLTIKGGGHNVGGSAVAADALTIDLSRMREVVVDPRARLAHVGPGCLLADVDRATQAHGLATPLGFVSEVGVAGLTLGGGLGYLTRRFGWTVDNLEEVEIVTADGAIRVAGRAQHADLFWALRGGGGNFGVVTRFTFRLHPVGPAVFGGLIAWPFERAPEVLRAYRGLTESAPRELAVWSILTRAPAAPFVPAAWQGRRVCVMSVCHSGDPRRAEEDLAPIRALGDPAFDLLREQPYAELQSQLDAAEPKGNHYYWKTELAAALDDALLARLQELAAHCPIPQAQLGILHLGGRLNELASDDGAVGNRDARYALGAIGVWEPDEPNGDAFRRWIRDAWTRFRPFSTGGNYVNFQTADEGQERVRASYGKNFDRLVALKRKFDPENLFRSNRNISPA